MSLQGEMKRLTEEITAAHKERDQYHKERVTGVATMLGDFDREQTKMAKQQKATFAADEKARLDDDKARLASFKKMMAGIDKTISELAKYTAAFLTDFQTKRLAEFKKSMAELNKEIVELRKYTETMLADHEKERASQFKALMERINKEIEVIEDRVAFLAVETEKNLKEMDAAHAAMANAQKVSFAADKKARLNADRIRLTDFNALMKGIDKEIGVLNNRVELLKADTQKSLAETRADHQAAAKVWLGMGKAPAPKPIAAPPKEPKPAPPPMPKIAAPIVKPKEEPKPVSPPALEVAKPTLSPVLVKTQPKPPVKKAKGKKKGKK